MLCILLMIRLNAEHRALMAKRRVPCLDDYLDRINLLLWPRFKVRPPFGSGPAGPAFTSLSACRPWLTAQHTGGRAGHTSHTTPSKAHKFLQMVADRTTAHTRPGICNFSRCLDSIRQSCSYCRKICCPTFGPQVAAL